MASAHRRLSRLALAIGAVVLALGLLETVARLAADGGSEPLTDLSPDTDLRARTLYEIAPDIGFRPVLGGPHYDEHGAKHNGYPPAKAPGTERVLFIGDSVTARGRIVRALALRADRPGREWWNAGVESFDLCQSVEYFLRHSIHTAPDRVVLTFHVNDFQVTPVSFVDSGGRRRTWTPRPPRADLWPFAWERSHLWRAALRPFAEAIDAPARERATYRCLERLRDVCRARGLPLHVLVAPPFFPPERWYRELSRWHALAIAYCRELDLDYTDLAVPIVTAAVAGAVIEEAPEDWAHPSQAAADAIADHLVATGVIVP